MDSATAVLFDGTRLFAWINAAMWLSMRIGAAMLAAPLFGARALPGTVRVALVFALAAMLAPMLPVPPPAAFDARTVLTVARELALGLALGFIVRLAFEAGALAGELVSQGMALSFAQMADPLRGSGASGVLGQWFYLSVALLFLAFDGHIAMIRLIVDSYRLQPPGQALPDMTVVAPVVLQFFSSVLAAGVSIALPIMLAMLIINLCFGVLSRAAPSLNPIQVGLPASLLVGLVLLAALTAELARPTMQVVDSAFSTARELLE